MTVKINKPIYQTNEYFRVGIRKEKLERAVRLHELVRVITPDGEGVIDPKEVLSKGECIPQVFLRPDEPMLLYHYNVKREKPIDSLQYSLM
jgi:hypothetical protein